MTNETAVPSVRDVIARQRFSEEWDWFGGWDDPRAQRQHETYFDQADAILAAFEAAGYLIVSAVDTIIIPLDDDGLPTQPVLHDSSEQPQWVVVELEQYARVSHGALLWESHELMKTENAPIWIPTWPGDTGDVHAKETWIPTPIPPPSPEGGE